jgi:hypothetical protein
MKPPVDLPDERKRGSASAAPGDLKLPLVECAREARVDEEMTPERVAEVLLEEEGKVPISYPRNA